MSQEQYTLGRNVQQYLLDFHLQYKSVKESASLLPQPMQSIVGFVNETVKSFESGYNLGTNQKDMLEHCRPTVEKYIFGKLHDKLFAMYRLKNETQDRQFGLITDKMRDHQNLLKFLGVRDKFIFSQKPYTAAIKELEKIQHFDNPQEMVHCLSIWFAKLKSEVVDQHKGKFELESMDDVLPLSIYCFATAEMNHAASLHNMMSDYLKQVPGFDLERKLLCNFDCAVKYVCNEYESECLQIEEVKE